MGMIGCFRILPDGALTKLFGEPSLLPGFLDGDFEEYLGPYADLDIDKAWHGIHFLLTGSAWEGSSPLNFLIAGGTAIGTDDAGYGPARGFYAVEVKEIAKALEKISSAAFAGRFNAEALGRAEIYPNIWERDGDEARAYLVTYFEQLQGLLLGASERSEALIVYVA